MKQVDKILRAYKLGEENARDGRGNHAGNFKGAEKKGYQNGYKDGQKAVLNANMNYVEAQLKEARKGKGK